MCGIAGIVYNNALKDYHDIQNMNDAISHRGPDGEGFIAINTQSGLVTQLAGVKTPINCQPITGFTSPCNAYLAHRRLSIIDLSKAGHQPMGNANETLWITFNGEIYNYKSLRNELLSLGYTFQSETDTEVLLYAYQEWGTNCLEKLNGMWAFVIYDKKKNILFGARDRFGVKPFYYTQTSEFFAFNSEIKGLLRITGIQKKANAHAAAAYLTSGLTLFGNDTFIENIHELEVAHMFFFDLATNEFSSCPYFELAYHNEYERFNEKKAEEYIARTRELVSNAIRLRLNADVTVGSCLSGGIDSSSIVCGISQLLKNKSFSSVGANQAVVTACYRDSAIDESSFAQTVVEHTKAVWHTVFPQKNGLLDDLDDLIYSQDIPFGSTSIYAQYRVMKTAKAAGLTVMLDGQGGDELFTGYTPYYNRFYTDAFLHGDKALLRHEQACLQNTPFPPSFDLQKAVKKRLVRDMVESIIPGNVLRVLKSSFSEGRYLIRKENIYHYPKNTSLNQMLSSQMSRSSLPQLLKYEDRNSMRFSIESRTPFADDIDLIQYVFSIPGTYKIHNGWSKYLLRSAMEPFLPQRIFNRTDKIGFATPEYEWLDTLKPLVFERQNNDLNQFIKMDALEQNWDLLLSKQNKTGITKMWRLVNFVLWFNKFDITA